MSLGENSIRINVTMSKELAKWVENKSKELGITKSALVAIATGQYKTQVVMTDLVSRISPADLQKMLEERNLA
jgi:hypothetical protein